MNRTALLFAAIIAGAAQSAAAPPLRYDVEYPLVRYSNVQTDNQVTRLSNALRNGTVTLQYHEGRGYLDALLRELGISPSSQLLVFSKTSIHADQISSSAPRAIYFNDETYVAWVQDTSFLEIATLDPSIGTTFYILDNQPSSAAQPRRVNGSCLQCHDTYGLLGGGTPRLMAQSTFTETAGRASIVAPAVGIDVSDSTPIHDRWGGWYVTGRKSEQKHRGNIAIPTATTSQDSTGARGVTLESLAGSNLLDIRPYITPFSDIAALLVFEHQITVQNQIVYVKFKAPSVLTRAGLGDAISAGSWDSLPQKAQTLLTRMLDKLIEKLLLSGAAKLESPIQGSSGFDAWYTAQGPRDPQHRSLRDLDLQSRLLRYPLSPMIYSKAFDSLPDYGKDYVYRQLRSILDGSDRSGIPPILLTPS